MRHIFLVFCLLIALSNTAFSAVLVFSPNGQYTTKADIAAAASASDAAGKKVVITSPYNITSNTTWPSDRTLEIANGGLVTVSPGVTFTINGPFRAGTSQCFAGSGTVSGLKIAYIEWFGGGHNINSSDAMQAALGAGSLVKGVAGSTYNFTGTVAIASGKTLDLTGCTIKRKTGSGVYDMLTSTSTTGIRIIGPTVDGNKDADSLVAATAAHRFSGIRLIGVNGGVVENVCITGTVNGEVQTEGNRAGIVAEGCSYLRMRNIEGYNNDRTAVMFVSCTHCAIDFGYFYNNTGSGVASANNDYASYSNIWAHDNGYSQVSINGIKSDISHITAWNGATGYSGVNIGHDSTTGRSHGTTASNIVVYNNAGWGLTISGSNDVKVDGIVADGNTNRNIYVFGTANRVKLTNVTACNGQSTGILFSSGADHYIDSADVYSNGTTGISIDSGVSVTLGPGVNCFNNGTVTSSGSAGLIVAGTADIRGGKYYDDQGTKTQESAIWLAAGTASINGPYAPTCKTYSIRETSSPKVLTRRGVRLSATDKLEGTFTATVGTTTTVNNSNVTAPSDVRLIPANSGAATLRGFVSSVVVGTSFTITFTSSAAGTENFMYEIK